MGLNGSGRSTRGVSCFRALGAGLILLFGPTRAWSWGCEGHQAVAMIAEKHMNAHALETANKLLRSQPIDPALSPLLLEPGARFDSGLFHLGRRPSIFTAGSQSVALH